MALVREILQRLEDIAPERFAFEFDKVGLQVGGKQAEVRKAAYSLDRSLGAIEFAKDQNCQLLLSHHPLIFTPIETVDDASHVNRSILRLASSGIAFVAAHTNWDCAKGGINDVLAKLFDLRNVQDFGTGARISQKKLVFFCPADSSASVLDAVCEAGAGVIGAYRRCSFWGPGTGSFIAGKNAHPTLGDRGVREDVEELRVEVVLPAQKENAVVRALLRAHPYEEPAFDLYLLSSRIEQADGRVGEFETPLPFRELLATADRVLETRSYGWGSPEKVIRKVAVVGGAADGEWMAAQRAGADVLITGEVKQHVAVEASESGLCIVASGHYATENPGAIELGRRMAEVVPDVEWLAYEPQPGSHGRPCYA